MHNSKEPKPNLTTIHPTTDIAPAAAVKPAAAGATQSSGTKKHWWQKLTKKQKIIFGLSAGAVIIAAGGLVAWKLTSHKAPPPKPAPVAAKPAPPPQPKLVEDPLTGLMVSPESAAAPVTGVVIENLYPSARPQSGLSAAGIVYEALAEGGITRYEGFFQQPYPPDFGPVRSLRTYFAYWGREYNVPVVHAGGNADALDLAPQIGMKNLDGLDGGVSNYFRRINSRPSPHNFYISGPQLTSLVASGGFNTAPDFTPWPYKDDTKVATPNATTITVNFSYFDYQAKFVYDPGSNSYNRFVRGQPDIDANTKTQLAPKNVIVMYMPTSYGTTRIGEQTVIMGIIGSGQAQIFRDGTLIDATWQKTNAAARTTFTDAAGNPVPLNRGQTWVSVVPVGKTATVQ